MNKNSKNDNPHLVSARVWGDFACFTRPEMSPERVSYPIMTPSAARGVLEAIFWEPQICYLIDHIKVVHRGRWLTIRRNEVSEVISVRNVVSWMNGKVRLKHIHAGGGGEHCSQRYTTLLTNVEYVITAEIRPTPRLSAGQVDMRKYLNLFNNRATTGKCYHRPYLGCREFDAFFELASGDEPAEVYDDEIGLMFYDWFDPEARLQGQASTTRRTLFRASVHNGVLDCHPDRAKLLKEEVD